MNALDRCTPEATWIFALIAACIALLVLYPPIGLIVSLIVGVAFFFKPLLRALADMWSAIGYLLLPFVVAPIIAHFSPMDAGSAFDGALGVVFLLKILNWILDVLFSA